jgi:hypothetical protein
VNGCSGGGKAWVCQSVSTDWGVCGWVCGPLGLRVSWGGHTANGFASRAQGRTGHYIWIWDILFIFLPVLEMEPRALHMLGKWSTTKPHP